MKRLIRKIVVRTTRQLKRFLYNFATFQDQNGLSELRNLPKPLQATVKEIAAFSLNEATMFTKTFLANNIQLIKKSSKTSEPILICATKNNLPAVKLQLKHHRKIGVTSFIYIDNLSTDGTFEYLKDQNDVTLYKVDTQFKSFVHKIWYQLAIKQEGYDKWYLTLDDDELFAYPGMETVDINRYIEFLEMQKKTGTFSIMLDMYSENKLFSGAGTGIKDEYCFFDMDYCWKGASISGGPRQRIFSMKHKLIKYPLLKYKKNMIIKAHKIYPKKDMKQHMGGGY